MKKILARIKHYILTSKHDDNLVVGSFFRLILLSNIQNKITKFLKNYIDSGVAINKTKYHISIYDSPYDTIAPKGKSSVDISFDLSQSYFKLIKGANKTFLVITKITSHDIDHKIKEIREKEVELAEQYNFNLPQRKRPALHISVAESTNHGFIDGETVELINLFWKEAKIRVGKCDTLIVGNSSKFRTNRVELYNEKVTPTKTSSDSEDSQLERKFMLFLLDDSTLPVLKRQMQSLETQFSDIPKTKEYLDRKNTIQNSINTRKVLLYKKFMLNEEADKNYNIKPRSRAERAIQEINMKKAVNAKLNKLIRNYV